MCGCECAGECRPLLADRLVREGPPEQRVSVAGIHSQHSAEVLNRLPSTKKPKNTTISFTLHHTHVTGVQSSNTHGQANENNVAHEHTSSNCPIICNDFARSCLRRGVIQWASTTSKRQEHMHAEVQGVIGGGAIGNMSAGVT